MNKDQLYDKGAELYAEGMYAEAIGVLLKAHAKDPGNIDVIILLAGCHINIAHFTDAARLLILADRLDADNPLIKYNLGYALLCMGRLNDATKCMKECLRLNPPSEIKNMAKRMLESKKYFAEGLENNYDISLEEEFECAEKFSKAQEHLYANRFEEAVALYKYILDKKPNFHRVIQNIGVCYTKSGQPEEALKFLENALHICPQDALCLGNLANAQYLLGNQNKSREYSEKAMTVAKEPLLRDLIRLVTLFIDIEQFEFARKLLDNYKDAHDNAQLTFLSGVLYAKQKEYLAAKNEFCKIRHCSNIARKYLSNTEQIIAGRINEYDFEPKIAVDCKIDMI